MRRNLILITLAGIAVSGLFTYALPANAEQVCCSCKAPGDALNTQCVTMDSADLGSTDCSVLPTRAELESGWTCDKKLTPTQCKPIPQNGLCSIGPLSASAYKTARKGETVVSAPKAQASRDIPFEFNTQIPGFEPPADMSKLAGAYIIAAYRYMISIVAIAATIMFIFGAFVYMVGSSMDKISKGKEIMFDSIVGMLLVLGATLILRTLNPNLISFDNINVTPITGIEIIDGETAQKLKQQAPDSPQFSNTNSPQEARYVDAEAPIATPETLHDVPDGGVPAPEIGPDQYNKNIRDLIMPYVLAQAKAYEIHPCYVIATFNHESNWRIVVGHDENFNNSFGGSQMVNSRLRFLRSGKKYSGETFSMSVPGDCSRSKASPAERKQCVRAHDSRILNDDKITAEPPDFGLDWRFSHGIGLGQATLFPKTKCGDGTRGITYHGRCYTPPELVTVKGSVDATLRELKAIRANKDGSANPEMIFRSYIGGGIDSHPVKQRAKTFRACLSSGKYNQ